MNDKETIIMCGAIVHKPIYDKAVKICKEHGDDLNQVITAFIEGIASGDIVITENHFEGKRK